MSRVLALGRFVIAWGVEPLGTLILTLSIVIIEVAVHLVVFLVYVVLIFSP